MAKNTVPIVIGAVLFGVLAVGLTFYAVLGGGRPSPTPTPDSAVAQQPAAPSTVWVARRPIYPRTVITSDMLEEVESDAAVNPNAITNKYDVIGRLANRTIQPGQIITTEATTSGLGRVIPANIAIPAGLRGVAIWVNPEQTAAGLVDIGDRVDVVATHELQIEKTGSQVIVGAVQFTAGRTIAQDLEVLAVDRSIRENRPDVQPAPGANGQPAAAPTPTPAPGTPGAAPAQPQPQPQPGQVVRIRVLLAAPPEIAQRLVAANAKGELHITIRNPNSRERFAQGEAREYPSRVIGSARPAGAAPSGGGRDLEEARIGADLIKTLAGRDQAPVGPALPAPTVPPFNPNAGTAVPAPAPEKDVTVIRGTEKTRVIVPR